MVLKHTLIHMLALLTVSSGRMGVTCGQAPEPRWWKGNLQTQSYWSDGDQLPEEVCAWYKTHGYHFVALSDHDRPPVGEMWKTVGAVNSHDNISAQVHPDILEQYRNKYGDDWVETREQNGQTEVRLKPIEEFGPLLNEAQRFLVMPSHQICTQVINESGATPPNEPGVAWLDIINSTAPITAGRDHSPTVALQKTIDTIEKIHNTSNRAMLIGLAHPNYAWQLTDNDLVAIDNLRFMEIYTGLPQCLSNGDAEHCSVERLWDIVLTRRLSQLKKPVIYALASDDAHTFTPIPDAPTWGRPGRGWIMVRSRYLTPESIFQAMQAGDFYASSGVVLHDVRSHARGLTVNIQAEAGVRYTTQYIGTRIGYDPTSQPVRDSANQPLRTTARYSDQIGYVLFETQELQSSYTFKGDEIYVRARIVSDRPHPDPSWPGQTEVAWTQPAVPKQGDF